MYMFEDISEDIESINKFRNLNYDRNSVEKAYTKYVNSSTAENDGEIQFYAIEEAKVIKIGNIENSGVPIRENLELLYYDYISVKNTGSIAVGNFTAMSSRNDIDDNEVDWYGLNVTLSDVVETIDLSDLKCDGKLFIVRLFRCKNFKNIIYPKDANINVKVINEKYLVSYMLDFEEFTEFQPNGYLTVPIGTYKQPCLEDKNLGLKGYLLIKYDNIGDKIDDIGFIDGDLKDGTNELIGGMQYTIENDCEYGNCTCKESIDYGAHLDIYDLVQNDYKTSTNRILDNVNKLIDKLLSDEDFKQAVINYKGL